MVAPAASLLFSPLRPLINMQMQDICKTSGCQITSNENLADFSNCARIAFLYFSHTNQESEEQNCMADLTDVEAKNAKVHLMKCDKPV